MALLIFFVDGNIAFTLLHHGLITQRYLFRHPPCDVLCRGVEREHFVKIGMVERFLNLLLDEREVHHHTVGIQFTGLTKDCDLPIMAMNACAFTLIGK